MRGKLSAALLALCAIIAVYATSDKKIIIVMQNSISTEYDISEIKEVSFPNEKMSMTISDGQKAEYAIDDIMEVNTLAQNDSSYAAIDLGLSVKWASMNIGANNPGDYGEYYAWGERETKSKYDSTNSLWIFTPNQTLLSTGVINGNNNLTPTYDVASAKWGQKWRMPTIDEFTELVKECTWTWTSENGNNGYKVTGPNGNSIFLPAAGWHTSYGFRGANSEGYYWSSTVYSYKGGSYEEARCLDFSKGNKTCTRHGRDDGMSIRPVTSYSD